MRYDGANKCERGVFWADENVILISLENSNSYQRTGVNLLFDKRNFSGMGLLCPK